ncbi:hypothetical protein WCLP8_2630020 [uncultured Gammaproteobacteria bacterium]
MTTPATKPEEVCARTEAGTTTKLTAKTTAMMQRMIPSPP